MLMAEYMGVPFVPIRKKGKLPAETFGIEYDLEYGQASIEIHKDAIKPNQKVLLHDDLLATGGTIVAAAELIKLTGAELVGFSFLVSLDFLNGREKLNKYSDNIVTLANY
jgi:adenine phosphoribosyltransferase